jgi:hypothetical protein
MPIYFHFDIQIWLIKEIFSIKICARTLGTGKFFSLADLVVPLWRLAG